MDGLLDLTGKIALVTGGGQGVGRATAMLLAQAGASVVVNDFHVDRAIAVAEEIEALGGVAMARQADITNLASVEAMASEAVARFGRIDILVNNAGNAGPSDPNISPKPFWETSPEEWEPFISTNFNGVMNCCKAVLPFMTQHRGGRIITVISDAGRVGEPHLAAYSGAKAGAAGFMRAIAKAVGRFEITANCVALSTVRTPGVASMIDEGALGKILKSYVIRRLGEPSDAAGLILFLASGAAGWITGQTYPVNGGYSFSS